MCTVGSALPLWWIFPSLWAPAEWWIFSITSIVILALGLLFFSCFIIGCVRATFSQCESAKRLFSCVRYVLIFFAYRCLLRLWILSAAWNPIMLSHLISRRAPVGRVLSVGSVGEALNNEWGFRTVCARCQIQYNIQLEQKNKNNRIFHSTDNSPF